MSFSGKIGSLLTSGCMMLAALGFFASGATAATKPNFIVIQTDDQPVNEFEGRLRDLNGNWRLMMPHTMALLRDQGIVFNQYMTPFPLCAPSRASLLSGQYTQNHGVVRIGGPRGGWQSWQSNPIMQENLPVWLQRAGYRTAHFGKFMNHYGGPESPAETIVPPGWDRWVSDATDNSTREFYGYQQNIDGEITPRLGWPWYDEQGGRDPEGCPTLGLQVCNYHTDSMSIQAEEEIRGAGSKPFYIQVDYHAPHGDFRPPIGPEPATRHYDTALRTPGPRPPGFNERDISDKPKFLRDSARRLSQVEINQLDTSYRKSIEALRSVDEGVGRLVTALRETGKLNNTYVIFTSDNGFFTGQHRIHLGKLMPYEPALKVPFVMRGPGIKAKTRSGEPVANQDVAPTILGLAGARAGQTLDGRSMERFWRKPEKRSRRPILLSSYQQITNLIPGDYPDPPVLTPAKTGPGKDAGISARSPNQNYVGIRLGPYKYIRYENGEVELYVLRNDPAELNNRARSKRYRNVVRYMETQLTKLRGCVGQACRKNAPRWPKP